MQPLVIDISAYQPQIDFAAVKAAGIVGVIAKATQGHAWTDRTYAYRRQPATAAGLLWGAYHFFDFTASPIDQAAHFLAVAAPHADTLVCLDWENVPPSGMEPSAAQAKVFLMEIESSLGRKAVIYSGNVAKEQIRGADGYFGAHRLWLCQYGSRFSVQESWQKTGPWLWQNNGDHFGPGPHAIAGCPADIDNSTIVPPMTVERLKAEWAS